MGVDDYQEGMPSVRTAFHGVTNDTFNVVISHSPDVVPDLAEQPCSLILCGHTHGVSYPGTGIFMKLFYYGHDYTPMPAMIRSVLATVKLSYTIL